MVSELKRWGNSLALRIPKDTLMALGLEEGSQVSLEVEGGRLIVRPSKKTRLQLLLKQLQTQGPDPHGELDWGEEVGKERF